MTPKFVCKNSQHRISNSLKKL